MMYRDTTSPTSPELKPLKEEEQQEEMSPPSPPPVVQTEDIFAPLSSSAHTTSLLSEIMPASSKRSATSYTVRAEEHINPVHQTPITSRVESPLHTSTPSDTSNVRTISEEPMEMAGIKVRPVQRTRWTPDSRNGSVHRESPEIHSFTKVSDPRAKAWSGGKTQEKSSTPPMKKAVVVQNKSVQPATAHKSMTVPHRKHSSVSCSHCQAPITRGPVMSIPERQLHFHTRCLTCVVCNSPISIGYGHTTVFLRQSLPHCASCYSNDNGKLSIAPYHIYIYTAM